MRIWSFLWILVQYVINYIKFLLQQRLQNQQASFRSVLKLL